jgi:hypothetical protein
MKPLLLLTMALALAFPASAEPAEPAAPARYYASFAGINPALPIPPGYCVIPRTGQGAPFYQLQDHSNAGVNVVAALFADCKEWKLRESDPNYRLHRHGSYLFQLSGGAQQLAPSDYTRARYIAEVTGLKFDAEELRKGVNQKVDTSGIDTGKMDSLSIRPIAFDRTAAYLIGASKVKFPSGEVMVAMVVGATLVKGVPVSMNLYRDYENTAGLLAAVEEHKANMARLDKANP